VGERSPALYGLRRCVVIRGLLAWEDILGVTSSMHEQSQIIYKHSKPFSTKPFQIPLVCSPNPPPNPLFPHPHIYRTFPLALAGTPFCPILLWILAPGWPLAPAAALLAFSAFFLLSLAVFFSFPSLMAACRAACRASGRCERRSLMTSREAPTMPRWDFTVRRVRFLAISWEGGRVS